MPKISLIKKEMFLLDELVKKEIKTGKYGRVAYANYNIQSGVKKKCGLMNGTTSM